MPDPTSPSRLPDRYRSQQGPVGNGLGVFQLILSGHSLSLREVRQESKAGTVSEHCLPTCSQALIQLPFSYAHHHLPRDGAAQGGLGPLTFYISNQKNTPQISPCAQLIEIKKMPHR